MSIFELSNLANYYYEDYAENNTFPSEKVDLHDHHPEKVGLQALVRVLLDQEIHQNVEVVSYHPST